MSKIPKHGEYGTQQTTQSELYSSYSDHYYYSHIWVLYGQKVQKYQLGYILLVHFVFVLLIILNGRIMSLWLYVGLRRDVVDFRLLVLISCCLLLVAPYILLALRYLYRRLIKWRWGYTCLLSDQLLSSCHKVGSWLELFLKDATKMPSWKPSNKI